MGSPGWKVVFDYQIINGWASEEGSEWADVFSRVFSGMDFP
jgi:hypothetical protein